VASFDYQPVLKCERVELRPLQAEDYEDLYAVGAEPSIAGDRVKRLNAPAA
jgi:hypothetical protein